MMKPLCPILLIGFNPPEEGQRDLRRCNKECALFNEERDTCVLNALYEKLEEIDITIQETSMYDTYGDGYTYEDIQDIYERETTTKL